MDQAPPPPTPPVPPPPSGGTTIPQRRITEILEAAFDLYRRNWQTLMGITAIVVIPVAFVQAFLTHLLTQTITTRTIDVGGTGTQVVVRTTPGFGRTLIAEVLLALLSVFVWALLTGAITRAVASETAGLTAELSDSYHYAMGRAFPIIWLSILIGLAVGFGFLLLIIPGIFILVKVIVSVPSLVVEDRRGSAAFGRSWALVKGSWWHVAGAIVLAWLITLVVSAILSAPFSAWPVRAIGSAIAQIVTLPFSTTVGVLVYLDLRARTEALTVETLRNELQRQTV
jgi:hypothetical protein